MREAFGALLAYIEGDYARAAPEVVGLWQYQGGHSAYTNLIRHHMTLAFTPEQVHQHGIELVAAIEDNMARVRAELGFKGTGREFLDHVKGKAFGARRFPPMA